MPHTEKSRIFRLFAFAHALNSKNGEKLVDLCIKNNVPVSAIGMVGGDDLTINEMVAVSLKAMHDAYYNSLPKILAKA